MRTAACRVRFDRSMRELFWKTGRSIFRKLEAFNYFGPGTSYHHILVYLSKLVMYNGIGLPTARGSGTNGFIQRNLAHVSKKRQTRPDVVSQPDPELNKPRNPQLVLHQRKREIESRCLRLKSELEDEGWKLSEIEEEVNAYRRRKLKALEEEFSESEPKEENTEQKLNN